MYKAYFAIEKQIKSNGISIERDELIQTFTEGKKCSLKSLSHGEYKEFLKWLKQSFQIGNKPKKNVNWQNSPANRMRRKVYSLFVLKMGYTEAEMNKWCVTHGAYKKRLQDHSEYELVHLVSQAEQVHNKYITALNQ